jgi:Retrotransposon gag protein/Zinc knuckle
MYNDDYTIDDDQQEQQQEETTVGDGLQQNMVRILNALNQNLRAISQHATTTTTTPTGTGTAPPVTPRETKMVDLPIFNGGEQDPLIWLEEFEDACLANRISNERKIDVVPAYLKGIAHSWWNQIRINTRYWNNNCYPAQSFIPKFKTKWCTVHQKSRWMNQLRNRTQKSGETVDEYLDAITRLYNKVDPNRNYPDEDQLRQFINGLRDEIREPVEISCPANIEEAINRARAAEATFSRNAPLSSYSLRRNYLGQNTDEMKDIKEALNQLTQGFQQLVTLQNSNAQNITNNNNRRETRSCNNCGRTGHLARDCRSRSSTNNNYRPNRINYNNNNNRNFTNNNNNNNRNPTNNNNRRCFTCNQPGHLASQCPQRSGNQNNPTNRTSTNNRQSPGSNTGQNNQRNQWLNMPMEDFANAVYYMDQHLND